METVRPRFVLNNTNIIITFIRLYKNNKRSARKRSAKRRRGRFTLSEQDTSRGNSRYNKYDFRIIGPGTLRTVLYNQTARCHIDLI